MAVFEKCVYQLMAFLLDKNVKTNKQPRKTVRITNINAPLKSQIYDCQNSKQFVFLFAQHASQCLVNPVAILELRRDRN